ncbi:MAG TPA: hypothetical protein VE958_07165 [Bryobacteraceae bacterium]|jgi:hypothetical protein|nr:hypothetical protein [Bryobacteraceae bacterium]
MKALRRLIFWEFPRTSWQWDIIVTLILAFIFLTPREVFRDQPRAASIQMLPAQQGYLIEPKLLANVPESDQLQKATDLVNQRFKSHTTILRVEPVFDEAEEEITGYMAYTKP